MDKSNKKPANNVTLEQLEAMLAEDMEDTSLFGCDWNFFCVRNSGS